MKVGTSAIGAHAAQSHTASIAGNDQVTDAVLAENGLDPEAIESLRAKGAI